MDPNDLLKSMFRGFFGFPRRQDDRSNSNHFGFNDGRQFRDAEDDDDDGDPHSHGMHETNPRGFTVYTDPLELHKYFDQQMDEMLQMFGHSFGFGGLGNREGFGVFSPPPHGGGRMLPLDDQTEESASSDDHARDFMLREDPGQPRVDTEVDWDKLDREEIDRLMTRERRDNGRSFRSPVTDLIPDLGGPGSSQTPGGGFSFQSFSSSVSERSVTRPHGGVETTRTVRSSDGSEEVTVTRRRGDQEHQVVTRRDGAGATVTEENLVNIPEADLESFKKSFDNNRNNSPGIQREDARRSMIQAPPTDSAYNKLWDKFFGN